jgi:argininosuccinate lyase
VRKGLPFRDAHEVIGKIVLYAIQSNKFLLDLSFEEYQGFSPLFEEDIYVVLAPEHVVGVRNSFGGTAPEQVEKQIKLAEGKLQR